MKKTYMGIVWAFAFLMLLSSFFVHAGYAQIYTNSIEAVLPFDGSIHSSSNVQLVITGTWNFNTALDYPTLNVTLDGQCIQEIPVDKNQPNPVNIIETVQMTKLGIGGHTVQVDATYAAYSSIIPIGGEYTYNIATLRFYVVDPKITPLSISGLDEQKTRDATFNITTNLHQAQVSYSLDGLANITLQNTFTTYQNSYQYNVTLKDLPDGAHTLIAYATDTQNNTRTAQKTFTTNTSTTQPTEEPNQNQPNPTLTITAAIWVAAVIAIIIAVLFYRKYAKQATSNLAG
jgi:hypothetical protein